MLLQKLYLRVVLESGPILYQSDYSEVKYFSTSDGKDEQPLVTNTHIPIVHQHVCFVSPTFNTTQLPFEPMCVRTYACGHYI